MLTSNDILVGLLLLSFGGHYWRSALPIFEIYFLESKFLDSSSYGLLLALQSLPALFFPFMIGYIYDAFNHGYVIVSLLVITLLGQIIFVVGVFHDSFPLAACGQFIFGIGVCGVVAAQRAAIALIFKGHEGLGTGCVVAMSCISKVLGKSTTVPLVNMFHSFQSALLVGCLYSFGSLLAGVYVATGINITHSRLPRLRAESINHGDSEHKQYLGCVRITHFSKLPGVFYALITGHMLLLLVFHMIGNYLPDMLVAVWGVSKVASGDLASITSLLPAVMAPFIGVFVDRFGFRVPICLVAGVATVVATSVLLFSPQLPIVPLFLISVAETLVPTVMLSMVPLCAPVEVLGLAYGIVETADNMGNLFGNLAFGAIYQYAGSYSVGLNILQMLSIFSLFSICLLLVLDKDSVFKRHNTLSQSFSYELIPT